MKLRRAPSPLRKPPSLCNRWGEGDTQAVESASNASWGLKRENARQFSNGNRVFCLYDGTTSTQRSAPKRGNYVDLKEVRTSAVNCQK
jgi:hypothetical protein